MCAGCANVTAAVIFRGDCTPTLTGAARVGKRDGLQEARRLFDNLDQALDEDRISKRFKRGKSRSSGACRRELAVKGRRGCWVTGK